MTANSNLNIRSKVLLNLEHPVLAYPFLLIQDLLLLLAFQVSLVFELDVLSKAWFLFHLRLIVQLRIGTFKRSNGLRLECLHAECQVRLP